MNYKLMGILAFLPIIVTGLFVLIVQHPAIEVVKVAGMAFLIVSPITTLAVYAIAFVNGRTIEVIEQTKNVVEFANNNKHHIAPIVSKLKFWGTK